MKASEVPRFYVEALDVTGEVFSSGTVQDLDACKARVASYRDDPAVGQIAVYALQSAEQRETTFKSIV